MGNLKANRGLVEVAVMNKIRTLAFESIVNEAFMKALPFDRSELDMTCESTLGEYTKNVIDRMGVSKIVREIEGKVGNE